MKPLKQIISGPAFKILGYRPQRVTAAAWDREYREGCWRYLDSIGSLAGHASMLGYVQFLAPATILDVGCGVGLLASRLKVLPFTSLLGIDISAEAIAQAAAVADARTSFAVCEADVFETDRVFDVIIFNQIMNYLPDPRRTVARYARFLSPKGHIIVSMAENPRALAAWPLITRDMTVLDSMTFEQAEGRGTTKVLAKPSPVPRRNVSNT